MSNTFNTEEENHKVDCNSEQTLSNQGCNSFFPDGFSPLDEEDYDDEDYVRLYVEEEKNRLKLFTRERHLYRDNGWEVASIRYFSWDENGNRRQLLSYHRPETSKDEFEADNRWYDQLTQTAGIPPCRNWVDYADPTRLLLEQAWLTAVDAASQARYYRSYAETLAKAIWEKPETFLPIDVARRNRSLREALEALWEKPDKF